MRGMEKRVLVRFGPFEADLATGELWKHGHGVPIQQQPFRLLRALLARPGELVTRELLKAELWPEGTHVAFERGLTSALRKVREALDDRADAPVYIQTLPGRGYRFIAPVHPVTSGARPGERRPMTKPAPRRIAAIAAGLMLSVATIGPIVDNEQTEHLDAARALADYACLLKSVGRVQDALAAIERAHALAPDAAGITAQVGFYAHAAGRYEAEFPMLTKAIRQDPSSSEAWLHLGLAYARRGQFDEAIGALERAGSVSAPDHRVAEWLRWAETHRRDAVASRSTS